MSKFELSTMELHEILVEANMATNGAYDHIIKYEEDSFWDNFADTEYTPQEIINMALYGDYSPSDDFVGCDSYGNLESMTEEDYRQDLLDYYEEYSQELE